MIQDIHPHQFTNSFVNTPVIQEYDYVFHFKGNELLLKSDNERLEIPRMIDLSGCTSAGIFLFTLNDVRCFLILDCPLQLNSQLAYHEITFRNPLLEKEVDWSSSVALQLRNWYEQNKFCGTCGAKTTVKTDERAVICPSCNRIVFPNISPAIIAAILSGDKILLARGANFPEGYFSLVAGYVDIGESIEGAITREVKEEVGIAIKNIRYYKSQPWPFSGSMMIGFIAEAEGEPTIRIDENEIVEASWFDRTSLPNYPPDRSIAGEIIEKFKKGELDLQKSKMLI